MFPLSMGKVKSKRFNFTLDDDDFEEHTRRFVPATTAADTQKCIKLFEDFVFAASVPDLCLFLLYINFEHRCSTLGCVV